MKELEIARNARVLVVAPHPDDESIGCGGLLLKYGAQIDILVITDGSKGLAQDKPMDPAELVRIRKEELLQAAGYAKVHDVFFLDIPDRAVWLNIRAVLSFDITAYQYIFVPNRFETHIDHKYLVYAFSKMIRRQKHEIRLYEYEVWSPIPAPDFYLDISSDFNKKIEMISMYNSQLECYDYRSMAEGIGRYRGAQNHSQYAEVYRNAQQGKGRKTADLIPTQIKLALKRLIFFCKALRTRDRQRRTLS